MKLLLLYLASVNLAGLGLFGLDKYRAVKNKWRIRESTLFLLALLGGSPGCLVGMYLFHHKTRHKKFTIGIPLILVLELVLGGLACQYFHNRIPYQQDPEKLVEHELSLLKSSDPKTVEQYLSYQDIFPTESADKTISYEVESVFTEFFKDFSYKIKKVSTKENTAQVTVALTTMDGQKLAKEYSRRTLVKQIQNSASPSTVEFSLEDCYLLLGTVLKENSFEPVTSEYTVSLTREGKIWSIASPGDFESALTGDFASYVSDVNLFTPSEIISIHLDTLKNFDSEQLSRYMALDTIFSGDTEYRRTISRALASQLLTYLDYTITSETISPDGSTAAVEMELTSYDCHSMMNQYREKVMEYTKTAQALQDGISGRLTKAGELLISCISENTVAATTAFTIELHNDGANWTLEMNDEITQALLGNINEAIQEISAQLQE
ncbi:MAG: DUF1294 domain-containing protein [Clostridiales bacterium]|nr:DUF1294 domain-containing protein [Clostridiales bacterium]